MASIHTRQTQAVHGLWGASTLPVILLIAALIVGLTALLPLVQSSGAASTASRVRELEQQRSDWQARLHEQEVKVAGLGSLQRIERDARQRLKLVPPKDIRYISVDAPPPASNRLPERFFSDQPPPPDPGKNLWQAITSWIPIP